MNVVVDVQNLSVVLNGIKGWDARTKNYAYIGVGEVLKMAKTASQAAINLMDHDLEELAAMGHPYSAEHGFQIHEPDELVHTQTGEYLDHLRVQLPRGGINVISEGRVYNDDPKDRWIQDGTLKMRARPWMAMLVQKYGEMWGKYLKGRILQGFGAGMGVNA